MTTFQLVRNWILYILIVGGILVGSTLLNIKYAEAADGYATYYTVASAKSEGTWQKWGGKMANGEMFHDDLMVCALPWKPDNKEYLVYCHDTEKSVVVRHSDKGPGKGPQSKGVVIDLTKAAWNSLGLKTLDENGVGKVKISYQEII